MKQPSNIEDKHSTLKNVLLKVNKQITVKCKNVSPSQRFQLQRLANKSTSSKYCTFYISLFNPVHTVVFIQSGLKCTRK